MVDAVALCWVTSTPVDVGRLQSEQSRLGTPAQASRSSHGGQQRADGGPTAAVSWAAQVPWELLWGQLLETLSGFPDGTFELC